MRIKNAIIGVALLTLFLLPVGCGAGGDESTPTAAGGSGTSTEAGREGGSSSGADAPSDGQVANGAGDGGAISKAEFVAAVNSICAKSDQEIESRLAAEVGKKGIGNAAKEAPAIVENVVVPTLEAEIEVLRALEVPPGGDQGVAAVTGALEETINEATANPEEFVFAPDPFAKSRQVAQAHGLKRCGL